MYLHSILYIQVTDNKAILFCLMDKRFLFYNTCIWHLIKIKEKCLYGKPYNVVAGIPITYVPHAYHLLLIIYLMVNYIYLFLLFVFAQTSFLQYKRLQSAYNVCKVKVVQAVYQDII